MYLSKVQQNLYGCGMWHRYFFASWFNLSIKGSTFSKWHTYGPTAACQLLQVVLTLDTEEFPFELSVICCILLGILSEKLPMEGSCNGYCYEDRQSNIKIIMDSQDV